MNENLLEISDGKLYKSRDMARLLCHDCQGCSSCCRDMDQSIVLDPYDVLQLAKATGKTFQELMNDGVVELHVEEGLMLPNLKMLQKSANLAVAPNCYFLNSQGRCSIHQYRPGICRLFPLGRNYDENGLSYFVLKDACSVSSRQKVKIDKWLGISNLKAYENYLVQWHDLKARVREIVNTAEDEKYATAITTGFLKLFYFKPYGEEFYNEFEERLNSL